MYDVVINKESDLIYLSVFDKRGNEIYNVSDTKFFSAMDKIKDQNFTISEYITSFQHNAIVYLVYSSLVPETISNPEEIPIALEKDKPIANESFTGFGLNRYVHRQFLKHSR